MKTDNLQRNREYNLGLPTPTGVAQRPVFPSARPLADLGSVQLRESSAESEFTGLTLTSRVTKGWGLISANYVLSKSMSDDDNERDSGGVQFENTYDLRTGMESCAARPPASIQWVRAVLPSANFDVSTNFRFLSGVPIDAAFGSDINASFGGPDRPYSAPGVPFERNAFRNEPFKEVNFKLQWGLPFGNGSRLLLFTDLFNVFNWDNIQLAGAAVTNYCAAPVPADCGFGEPTNPNVPLADRYERQPDSDQQPRTAAANPVWSAVPVLTKPRLTPFRSADGARTFGAAADVRMLGFYLRRAAFARSIAVPRYSSSSSTPMKFRPS